MLKIKIGDIEFDLPEGWHEVTFAKLYKFMQLESVSNFAVLEVMSGLSLEVLNKMRTGDLLPLEASLLTWINEPIDFTISYAPTLFFRGNLYQTPNDIGAMPVGIYKDLQAEISALGNEPTNLKVIGLYPLIVASYLQPMLNGGEYDYKEAEKLVNEIAENCEGILTIAFGNFFLANLAYLKNGSLHLLPNPNPTNTANLQRWQVTTIWQIISVLPTRLKNWFQTRWSIIRKGSAK
jgi:hypothetical protein